MTGVSMLMRPTTRVSMPLNERRYRAGHSRGRGHGQELPGGGHARREVALTVIGPLAILHPPAALPSTGLRAGLWA
jgi:hypothetical protein